MCFASSQIIKGLLGENALAERLFSILTRNKVSQYSVKGKKAGMIKSRRALGGIIIYYATWANMTH